MLFLKLWLVNRFPCDDVHRGNYGYLNKNCKIKIKSNCGEGKLQQSGSRNWIQNISSYHF